VLFPHISVLFLLCGFSLFNSFHTNFCCVFFPLRPVSCSTLVPVCPKHLSMAHLSPTTPTSALPLTNRDEFSSFPSHRGNIGQLAYPQCEPQADAVCRSRLRRQILVIRKSCGHVGPELSPHISRADSLPFLMALRPLPNLFACCQFLIVQTQRLQLMSGLVRLDRIFSSLVHSCR
jgi:hypothetical protein